MIRENIAVLGSGSWGTALARLLANNGAHVRLWGAQAGAIKAAGENVRYLPGISLPETLQICEDLRDAVQSVDAVLLAVPSVVFAETVRQVKAVSNHRKLAWATKGLDHEQAQLLSAVCQHEWPELESIAILSGPTFAAEVAKDLPSALNVASEDSAYARYWCDRLNSKHFHAYAINDIVGAQIGGAVKNAIAIAAGIVDGMGYGANMRCALITRGLVEMKALGLAMGAQESTFSDLAGIGDLMLTANDDQSRNRRFGLALGRDIAIDEAESSIGQVVEGRVTAQGVARLAEQLGVTMPIVSNLVRLFDGQVKLDQLEALWFV